MFRLILLVVAAWDAPGVLAGFEIQGEFFHDTDQEGHFLIAQGSDELACETIWDNWQAEVQEAFGWTRHNMIDAISCLPRIFDYVHLFCGKRVLDRRLKEVHLHGIGIDQVVSASMNLQTKEGILFALLAVLCLKKGGILCGGPDSKTWHYPSKRDLKREPGNIEGDTTKPMVILPGWNSAYYG